jgi:hypothetical protein
LPVHPLVGFRVFTVKRPILRDATPRQTVGALEPEAELIARDPGGRAVDHIVSLSEFNHGSVGPGEFARADSDQCHHAAQIGTEFRHFRLHCDDFTQALSVQIAVE